MALKIFHKYRNGTAKGGKEETLSETVPRGVFDIVNQERRSVCTLYHKTTVTP